MSKIRILPEILSNQIAAGEVVQRPASVVKELVENSVDAGADQITVEIEKGGRSLIRISDNGSGLERDDAILAIERYATSKVFEKEDLFSISTFGFRGEALPSIASVSKFTLVSRTRNNDVGTRIDINGGKLFKVSDTGAPAGTMVEVKHLFFNTPARRKFLKAESTEAGHISDAVSGLAMGNPDIGFRLFFNGKLVKNFPPGQDLFQRAQMVLGRDAADQLYPLNFPFDGDISDVRISGVCANPSVTRRTANRIYLFVNHRLVHDRGLIAALFQGYRGRIMKGCYPMGVVCVALPYDQVDVNVHPTKREIKFLMPQPVYQALSRAVSKALADAQSNSLAYAMSNPMINVQGKDNGESEPVPSPKTVYGVRPAFSRPAPGVAQQELQWGMPRTAEHRAAADTEDGTQLSRADTEQVAGGPATIRGGEVPLPFAGEKTPDLITAAGPQDWQSSDGAPMQVIGQVMGTYIVVEKENHLVLVDQHAAHERIVYEQLKTRHENLNVQSQSLLVPEVVELTHSEAVILESICDDLADLGVMIEPFGGTSFVIKAVPVLVEEKQVRQMVMEMVETLSVDNEAGEKDGWLDACLMTMACHRAVRAHQAMNHHEMTTLITDLMACENPMHCPHGRPIMVVFDRYRIEKLFKRVV
ncbi:MAG: DNA mismatch repair protein MutL [Desulfobacterales bacterium]|nr:MAG: DNA mismatch repair protein MutL [Desulfobacterales bacterium]